MNRLRQFLLKNLGLKGLSLLFAFLLWLQVAGQQTVQRTVTLPVEFVNIPTQLEISNNYEKTVEVAVRSERRATVFDERDMSVVVDLRDASAGIQVIRLTENNIRNRPVGVQILLMTPPRVKLQLDNRQRRIVEVKPELVGQPAEGFEVSNVKISPSKVVISGPESWVQGVSRARTSPINIGGLSSMLTVIAYIDLEDPRLRIEGTPSVQVAVDIEEKRREIRVRSVVVTIIPKDARVTIMNRKVDIIGTVPASFDGRIRAKDLQVQLYIKGQKSRLEPYTMVPEIEVVPEYEEVFRLRSIFPETIRVRVR